MKTRQSWIYLLAGAVLLVGCPDAPISDESVTFGDPTDGDESGEPPMDDDESESSSDDSSEPGCGNGVIDGDDVCDGLDVGDATCEMMGFETGTLGCTQNCGGYDLSGCGFFECGNGITEGEEDCDGTVGEDTCQSIGFDNGLLFCADDCTYNIYSCGICGNSKVDYYEDCDTAKPDIDETCQSLGYESGTVTCGDDCLWDESQCQSCGNGEIEGSEACDGDNLDGNGCGDVGFDSGTLGCLDSCLAYDTSGCGSCGNGIVDGDEVCDTNAFAGDSCVAQGFDNGTLTCSGTCDDVDNSSCGTCGNAIIDGSEDCDGANLGGDTCISLAYDSGTLGCSASCLFDTTACGTCGNGVIDGDEICDTFDFDGDSCSAQGFDSGSLTCSGTCDNISNASCGTCGNGIVDGSEACDGTNLGGATCASLGLQGGDLACQPSCLYDFTGCDIQGVPFGSDSCYNGLSLTPGILPCDDISATGTDLGFSDDDNSLVNIGFTFQFCDTNYTQVYITSNGSMTFGVSPPSYSNSCLPAFYDNHLAVFWDDLDPSDDFSATVRYDTLGTPGSQRFIVQWDTPFYFSNDSTEFVTFRAMLSEGTNRIDYCYEDMVAAATEPGNNGAEATVGTQLDSTDYIEYSCNAANVTSGLQLMFLPI